MIDIHTVKLKDSSALNCRGIYDDLYMAISEISQGSFKLIHRNIEWDIFINQKKSKNLYIILGGSRPKGSGATFKRWSWCSFMDGNMLNIDDPMYKIYPELTLGWYYGDDCVDYCDYVVEIVKQACKIMNISNVIFYASSGGGSAAIRCAAKLEGSIAAVINPQLIMEKYEYCKQFEKITGHSLVHDSLGRNDITTHLNSNSKFIVCINRKSPVDLVQLEHLKEATNHFAIELGLNAIRDNCLLWAYDAEFYKPHSAQEWPGMFLAINRLAQLISYINSKFIEVEYSDEYLIYSKFWNDYFEELKEKNKIKREITLLSSNLCAEGVTETIYEESNIEIKATKKRYNRIVLPIKIKPSTLYEVQIRHFNKSNIVPYFAIKDNIYNNLLLNKELLGEVSQIVFTTNKNVDEIELRIYPSQPGKTEDIGCILEYIRVGELCKIRH